MLATIAKMPVEEFLLLPEPKGFIRYELHDGGLIEVTAPRRPHMDVQYRLLMMLVPLSAEAHVVRPEFPFRATAFDFYISDVGVVTKARYEAISDYLSGAPDMVVEVVSPSNTPAELDLKEAVCLANGCREFWTVYPQKRYVRVASGDQTRRYREGDTIPLTVLPGQTLAVADIFSILPNSSQG